jgi:hypothetical protein
MIGINVANAAPHGYSGFLETAHTITQKKIQCPNCDIKQCDFFHGNLWSPSAPMKFNDG